MGLYLPTTGGEADGFVYGDCFGSVRGATATKPKHFTKKSQDEAADHRA
jgi:hypothetical protein